MNVLPLPGDHPRHHPLSNRRAPRRMSTGTAATTTAATAVLGTSDPNDDLVDRSIDKIRLSLPLSPPSRRWLPNKDDDDVEGKKGSPALGCILGFGALGQSSVSSTSSAKQCGTNPGATPVMAAPPEPTRTVSPLPSPSRATFHVSSALSKQLTGIASGLVSGGGVGARSLHKLFRLPPTTTSHHRSKSSRRQYLSVDCSDMSCVDIRNEAAETALPPLVTPPASPLKTTSGRRASLPICGGTPTTIPEMDNSSLDSLTDGYDGFYAGSLHSEQPQQQQQQQQVQQPQQQLTTKHAVPAARVSPRRRSSMPTVSVATLHDGGSGGGNLDSEHSHSPETLTAATWVHSPGSARAHLEFRPTGETSPKRVGMIAGPPPLHPATSGSSRSSSAKERYEGSSSDDCTPRGGTTADNHDPTARDVDVHAFLSAPSLSPCRSARLRHRYQRRRSAGGGFDGYAVTTPSPVVVSVVGWSSTTSSDHLSPASPTRRHKCQQEGTHVTTTPDEEEEMAVADLFTSPLSTSSSSSPSSLSSPRRKTRRTATARHITSRRRSSLSGAASPSFPSPSSSSLPSWQQHLQVPVV